MSCNEPARPGQHNCRGCNSQTSMCFWHGVPASSIQANFESMMLYAFRDDSASTAWDRLAPLRALRATSDAAMLPAVPGYVPLDDRAHTLIEAFAKIGRYGQPA